MELRLLKIRQKRIRHWNQHDWNGKHGQICQSSKSSYICSLDVCLDGNWIILTAWFFVYEVTCTKFTRDRMKELLISVVASIFMGLGSHFLILWVGIYV